VKRDNSSLWYNIQFHLIRPTGKLYNLQETIHAKTWTGKRRFFT
jgi:hypothetical protein